VQQMSCWLPGFIGPVPPPLFIRAERALFCCTIETLARAKSAVNELGTRALKEFFARPANPSFLGRNRTVQYRVDAREFTINDPDKVLFPEDGITKLGLTEYYRLSAPLAMPYLTGRPLTMHRFPDGIDAEGFYEKHIPSYFPAWISRATVAKEGGELTQVICDSPATSAYVASHSCITQHVWLSTVDHPHNPDQLIFDFDPGDKGFDTVRAAALATRELLETMGLVPFVKTTGSKGVHVIVPVDGNEDFETVRAFARSCAAIVCRQMPDDVTTEVRKEKRQHRLFIDIARNAYAQTAVAPFAVRAIRGAPVAVPISWDELAGGTITAQTFRLKDFQSVIKERVDPWAKYSEYSLQSLRAAMQMVATL
jgi:bifunctional non-homologous end joining protein LigD